MISLDDPDQVQVRQIHDGLQAELATWPVPPTLYREFYDQVRFGDREGYARDYIRWLHHKYQGTPIDLIIATEQSTLQLLADFDGNPWTGLPILYGTVGHLTIDISKSHPTAFNHSAISPSLESTNCERFGDQMISRRDRILVGLPFDLDSVS